MNTPALSGTRRAGRHPEHEQGARPLRQLLDSTGTPFTVADYEPRAAIFRQGAPCDSVMHIDSGRVWLAVTARSGKEGICSFLDSGAFLGEEALAGGRERRQSATAMTATRLLVIGKAHLGRLLRTQPPLLDRFIAHLLARNAVLEANLAAQLLFSSEQRLVHVLLGLASCDLRHPRRSALPDLPQEIIAEMVGTTRSRVNIFMSRFKRAGFIEECGRTLFVNPACLHLVDGNRRVAGAAPIAHMADPRQTPWFAARPRSAHGSRQEEAR